MISSHIVTVIFNQLNIKKKEDNLGENKKKTMRKNTVAINNFLKKKYYQTKFSISSILKKIDKYNFEKEKNKIEKLCGKKQQESTVFQREKITK